MEIKLIRMQKIFHKVYKLVYNKFNPIHHWAINWLFYKNNSISLTMRFSASFLVKAARIYKSVDVVKRPIEDSTCVKVLGRKDSPFQPSTAFCYEILLDNRQLGTPAGKLNKFILLRKQLFCNREFSASNSLMIFH